jgi:bacterioferritin
LEATYSNPLGACAGPFLTSIFLILFYRKYIMHEVKRNISEGIDTVAIREAAKNYTDGAVTAGYQADRRQLIEMLNGALATELVCVLRYKRHYYTAVGLQNGPIKAEFLKHAQEEQAHADLLAERIVQLNGKPNFNPAGLSERSHAEYDDSDDIQAMIKANLIAERVAIESYRQMLEKIGETDPTTRHMLVGIMAMEEEHADDMRDLLA